MSEKPSLLSGRRQHRGRGQLELLWLSDGGLASMRDRARSVDQPH
jgi:hypothetical protein